MKRTKAELLEDNRRMRHDLDKCLSDLVGWKAVCRRMEENNRICKITIETQESIIRLLEHEPWQTKEVTNELH